MKPLAAASAGLLLAVAALGQDPFGPTDPYESRFQIKPNFQIRFRVPEAGGEVRLRTRQPVRYERDLFWEGSEDVEIEYQDVKIRADRARYDFPTDTATLEGNVVIDQGPTRLSGDRATFRVKAKTGRIEKARADLAPTYHVIAESIEKVGEAVYRIRDGIFTACDVPNPEWSFFLDEATVTLDDYARMKNVSFRAGPVPVLYTPYLIWPTKEDRASGFLVPGIGYNSRRGAYLGLSYYWVTGRATDLTTHLDLYSGGALGLGEEFRWRPSLESAGVFQGFLIDDPEATTCVPAAEEPAGGEPCFTSDGSVGVYARRHETRWKMRLDHVSDDLPYGFRGVLDVREYSDEQFQQDYERAFSLSAARQTISRGFLTKNFGDHSVNLRVERNETFFSREVVQMRLPSLEYARRTSRIGRSPFYLALESSVSYLDVDRGRDLPDGSYGRFDLRPTLSFPWKKIPWLSITASAGGRFTGYSDSTDAAQQRFVGTSTTREYGEAGLSLVGPSFSRIYEGTLGPYARFKHVIEPRVQYEYVSEVDDPAQIPVYDEIDSVLGRNQVRYALVNRLLAKGSSPQASVEEIASLEISQTYALEPLQTTFASLLTSSKRGPLEGVLRVAPAGLFQFDARASYDTTATQLTAASLTAGVNLRTNYLNATWFASRPVPPPGGFPPGSTANTDQVRFSAGVDLGKLFRIDTQLNYDAQRNLLLEDRSLVTFNGSCFTVFVEVRQLRLPPDTRRDYRVVINLKDIGTLLDVNGSLDPIFGREP